jgi:REP element-mobilizing transposase RayT
MTSPVALQHGQYYHVYNRGNNRENVFVEERNYRYFLKLYANYIEPIADTYAYCLLRNHFHLLVRIKTVEEQEAMETLRVSETLMVFKPKKPNSSETCSTPTPKRSTRLMDAQAVSFRTHSGAPS